MTSDKEPLPLSGADPDLGDGVEGALPPEPPFRALEFRLPGAWERFTPGESGKTDEQVKDYVERLVGKRDEDSQLRAGLRMRLREGIRAAADGSAQALFVLSEIVPTVPTPVVMTVYAPVEFQISPAIGTDPGEVMRVFREGRTQLYGETEEDGEVLTLSEAQVLRTVMVSDTPLHPQAPDATVPHLNVDYWYTTPGSKRMVLVNFFTPLADIRHTMIEFFDSIVRASYFAAP